MCGLIFYRLGVRTWSIMLFEPWRTAKKLKNCRGGRTPKEILENTSVSIHMVYKELTRERAGTRLPDQRLRYSADVAQRRVQVSLERWGKRTRQAANMGAAADGNTAGKQEDTMAKRKKIKFQDRHGALRNRQNGMTF